MIKNDIEKWDVEDPVFWAERGKRVAYRNLVVSIPALLLSFALWMTWGMVIVQMKKVGFTLGLPHATPEDWKAVNELLWTLPAVAGLAGATLRIPNSFLVSIAGGRNVLFMSSVLLFVPAVGMCAALQDRNMPYAVFAALAVLSGIGGGNFASSMSNISTFFPKKLQGTALGLNAGIGNLGVSIMQVMVPTVIVSACFGVFGGPGLPLIEAEGGRPAGTHMFLQNAGWIWVPILFVMIAAYIGADNLRSVTPEPGQTTAKYGRIVLLNGFGLAGAAAGVWLMIGPKWNMWVVLPVTIVLTMGLMRFLSPKPVRAGLERQFAIFGDRHTWIMTVLYVMTFGSFIGYSASFPKLIQDVFGYLPDGSVNPNAPNPMQWSFLGPMMGAFIRPIGGWLADKINSGSKVTTWSTVVQVVAALAAARFVVLAKAASSPDVFWWPFFGAFIVLFVASGLGNGSTFRSIPYIFKKELTGPVLGWTSAVAAYGAFVIPVIFGQQIKAGHAEYAMYGFAVYYVVCLVLNWYYYDRKNSGVRC